MADPETTKLVLTGEYKKDELLEASRSGNEEKLMSLLTPLNVNCHASDGRKSTPLHLAAGYNRTRIVQLLLQHGADVHAKVFLSNFKYSILIIGNTNTHLVSMCHNKSSTLGQRRIGSTS